MTRASNNYGPYQFPEKLIPLMISNAMEGRRYLSTATACRSATGSTWRIIAVASGGFEAGPRRRNLQHRRQLLAAQQRRGRRVLEISGKPESLMTSVTDRPGHDRRYAFRAKSSARNRIHAADAVREGAGSERWLGTESTWTGRVASSQASTASTMTRTMVLAISPGRPCDLDGREPVRSAAAMFCATDVSPE